MKKTAAFLAAFMTLMSFAACSYITKDDNLLAENDITTTSAQDINYDTVNSVDEVDKNNAENDDIIYKSNNVTVTRCVPLETPNIVYNLWYIPTEEELFNENEVIVDVTINSLEEVGISYTYMGAEGIDFNTLANVSVNSIYYSDYENISQEFTVAIPNSSYSCDVDFPELAIGKRYIFFISSTNEIEDSLEICNYADYYLSGPAHIISIDGSECRANKLFSAYSSSSVLATKEQSVDLFEGETLIESNNLPYANINDDNAPSIKQYTMPLNDFEKTLIEKINKKNKEYGNQDNNSNVSVGEKSMLEISDTNDFTITAEKASPTGIEMKISNNSPKNLYWGSWFTIEKKENDGWYEVSLLELENSGAAIAWTNALAFLDSYETRNIEQQWENGYGKLSEGDYRIVKDFFFDERNQDEKIYVACEFSIEE